MADVKAIMFFESYFESAKQLPPEQRLQFYDAIFNYVFEGVEIELSGILAIMFPLVRENLNKSMLQAKQRKKAIDSRWAKSKEEPKQDTDTAVDTTVNTVVSYEGNASYIRPYIQDKDKDKEEDKDKKEEYNPPVSPLPGEQDTASADLEEPKKRKHAVFLRPRFKILPHKKLCGNGWITKCRSSENVENTRLSACKR